MSAPIRRALRLATLASLTSSWMPFYLASKRLARARGSETPVHNAWVRTWARTMLRTFGVHTSLEGPIAPAAGGRLVVANHRSAIDIVLLQSLFGGHLISRGDLSRWPLIGPAARAVGTLFLDRQNARSGASTLRALEGWLAEGRTVILFPEGTTFVGDEVRPFHAASFVAAARAGAEIVPVGIAYESGSEAGFVGEAFGTHLMRVSAARAIRLGVTVGAPLAAPPRNAAQAFAQAARETVQQLVERSRARVDHESAASAAAARCLR